MIEEKLDEIIELLRKLLEAVEEDEEEEELLIQYNSEEDYKYPDKWNHAPI
jgi:hypothetical protein